MAEIDVPPIPPERLQRRVVGTHVPAFVDVGARSINDLNAALAANFNRTIPEFSNILDFGCGCGRVLRSVATTYSRLSLTGCDIDAEAIAWCCTHYRRFATFITLPHLPPSSLPTAQFDLVYAISIFTHLPEQMQFQWLSELHRITSPGAVILLTVHGENYLRLFPQTTQNIAQQNGGFFYNDDANSTDGLPRFYKNAYHTSDYIKNRWNDFFEVVDYRRLAMEGHQDIVVCKRRP
jgi:SAM-dependent methyltransferase